MGSEGDEEIKELIEKIYKKIVKSYRRSEKIKERLETNDDHGIYVYDIEKGWKIIRRDGEAFQLGELGDGIYVLYFDNTRCPACRLYDTIWYPFVKERGREAYFIIILCEWFSRRCNSSAASSSFLMYRIKASPTTIFAKVEDNVVIRQVKREGVLDMMQLEIILESMKAL